MVSDKELITYIANKLKEIRLEKGLKQTDVAEKSGISANYYAKIERGVVNTSLLKLKHILKALEVKSSEVLPF